MYINISLFLFLFSIGSLATAYISQYVFGLEPCILCLYQRIPFFVIIVLSALSMLIKNKLRLVLVGLCGIALLVGAGIAFFHLGVEQGHFSLTDGCEVGSEAVPSTIEEMTTQLMGKPNVPCDKAEFMFLGLSMAGWNFLFSGSFGLITLIMVYRMFKNINYLERSNGYREGK